MTATHRLRTAARGATVVLGLGIAAIGTRFLVAPRVAAAAFGVAPPPPTDPYLAVKGVRDVASGVVLMSLLAAGEQRAAGIAMLALSTVPLGDAAIVLGRGGSRAAALGVHGTTAAATLATGVALLHTARPRGARRAA